MNSSIAGGDLETRITVRFAALVVMLLVLGIAIFVVVDTIAAEVRLDATLTQRAGRLAQRVSRVPEESGLPADARIVASDGKVVRVGEELGDFSSRGPLEGLGYLESPQGRVRVFAVPLGDGRSLQLLDAARPDVIDTLEKAAAFLVITVLVGVATYLLGLGFSRRALAPVRESLARLERFTADAGHELRTPLASVRASLDVAAKTGDWAGGVERARVELDRASALVDRLLELAHLDPSSLHLERVRLGQLIGRVVELSGSAAEQRPVFLVVEGDRGEVSADPILLERLVMNLVANAIRFGDGGSTVTVRFSEDAIEVHNRGAPIQREELARIFEPFYQSERSRTDDGSGLGLAIAAVIAQAHGWSLGATSSREAGTSFTLFLRPAREPRRP